MSAQLLGKILGNADGASNVLHLVLLLVIAGVLVSASIEVVMHRFHIRWLPEPATAITMGLILGAFVRASVEREELPDELSFSGTVFFLILLPIIIFESGYSLRKSEFFGQLYSILAISLVGTLLSAFAIGLILFWAGEAGWSLYMDWNESMAYASVLAATDSVAVSSVFSSLNAPHNLVALVYGEGAMNEAMSLVLYNTFAQQLVDEPSTNSSTGGPSEGGNVETPDVTTSAVAEFSTLLFGSVLLGVGIGILATYIFRMVHMGWVPDVRGMLGITERAGGPPYQWFPPEMKREKLRGRKIAAAAAAQSNAYMTPIKAGAGAGGSGGAFIPPYAALDAVAAAAAVSAATSPQARFSTSLPYLDASDSGEVVAGAEVKPDSSVFAQTTFVLAVGYISFMAAEACHLSGVVSSLFCGIALNHFARPLMTDEGKAFSEGTVKVLSNTADTAIFFQVGLDIALTLGTSRGIDNKLDFALLGWTLFAVLVGRAVAILPLCWVINYFRREPISWKYQLMLWHAGMRGASAYAFTLVFPGPARDALLDITSAVMLFTVVAMGITTSPLMLALGLRKPDDGHGGGHGSGHGSGHGEGHGERASLLGHGAASGANAGALEGGYQAADFVSPRSRSSDSRGDSRGSAGGSGSGSGSGTGLLPASEGSNTPKGYRVAVVQGARVYLPVAPPPNASERSISWLNKIDTILRWWVSGIIRRSKEPVHEEQ